MKCKMQGHQQVHWNKNWLGNYLLFICYRGKLLLFFPNLWLFEIKSIKICKNVPLNIQQKWKLFTFLQVHFSGSCFGIKLTPVFVNVTAVSTFFATSGWTFCRCISLLLCQDIRTCVGVCVGETILHFMSNAYAFNIDKERPCCRDFLDANAKAKASPVPSPALHTSLSASLLPCHPASQTNVNLFSHFFFFFSSVRHSWRLPQVIPRHANFAKVIFK